MEFLNLMANISVLSIVLFLVGIGFLVIELIEPGFGVFGILGIISLIVCIFITAQTVIQGLILTAVVFVIILVFLLIFMSIMSKGKLPKKLILHESETGDQGYSGAEDMQHMIGRAGVVTTGCRPAGIADFDGTRLDIVSRGEFIEKGRPVTVIACEGNRIVVKE